MNVIESVEKQTPWVSQLVITNKKDGSPRTVWTIMNLKFSRRALHYAYTVLHNMKDAKIFTKADLASGSSDLTTFQMCCV